MSGADDARLLKDALNQAIEDDYIESGAKRLGKLSISDISGCPRSAVYKLARTPHTNITPSIESLDDGSMWHVWFQKRMARMYGDKFKRVEEEVVIDLGDGCKLKGHPDGSLYKVFSDINYLIEGKTMNWTSWAYRKKKKEDYREQSNLYMGAMGLPRTLIVMKKMGKNFASKEHPRDTLDVVSIDFNAELFEQSKQRALALLQATDVNNYRRFQPDKAGWLDWHCVYCPYVSHCWGDEAVQVSDKKWRRR